MLSNINLLQNEISSTNNCVISINRIRGQAKLNDSDILKKLNGQYGSSNISNIIIETKISPKNLQQISREKRHEDFMRNRKKITTERQSYQENNKNQEDSNNFSSSINKNYNKEIFGSGVNMLTKINGKNLSKSPAFNIRTKTNNLFVKNGVFQKKGIGSDDVLCVLGPCIQNTQNHRQPIKKIVNFYYRFLD